MKKINLAILLFFIVNFASLALAQSVATLILNDTENQRLSMVVVDLELDGVVSEYYVLNGILDVEVAGGKHRIVLMVDDSATPGKDFFKTINIAVDGNVAKEIYLTPVGSLRGVVKDKLENLVGNVELKFDCINSAGFALPTKTDKFGSFSVDFMPVGSCKIFAHHQGNIGFKEVQVDQGGLEDIEINLSQGLISPENYLFNFLAALTLLAVAVLVLNKFRKKIGLKKREGREEKAEGLELGRRAEDVMKTLKEKEMEIVKLLVENKGQISQAKIRYETSIPKASLSRHIQSLERKRVIEVKKIGKINRIKLSDWFLSKEG